MPETGKLNLDDALSLAVIAILALPMLGAVICALVRNARDARWISLITSVLCFLLTIPLLANFKWHSPQPLANQFYSALGQIESIGFNLHIGVDGISIWLLALTTFLMPLAIAASFASIRERPKEYYAWMLALQAAMVGVFLARDGLLFYIFFELTLVPMFFIIGIWGGPQRRYAAGKFFLFTFTGSLFTLAAIIYLGLKTGEFDINAMVDHARSSLMSDKERFWLLLGFLAGFAVKVPLFPLHTWLPLAHTEAPTSGSVILAGVLLKLGTYGILRFALPVGFGTVPTVVQIVGIVCLVGIIYGALVAWVQQDIKKLVAYSSVSHLGFCVLGLAALNVEGVSGSILYMINHGLSTGALFLVVGMIYDRYHTRDINELSGLARKMPVLAFFFILFTLSSIGLPGLNGFVSEFLTILGAFKSPHLGVGYGVLAALGIILGAVYMLHMAARVIWGPLKTPGGDQHGHEPAAHEADSGETLPVDLNRREVAILAPIALAVVVLGVLPNLVLKTLEAPVRQLIVGAEGEQQQQGISKPQLATAGER
ncbi:MAG TPA: NADH-quinone oxidoreductase subunit M [Tepidisphaeraceae bacterium]|jgi:NADH-quinone oxidoreductase subunit M|nr:NADH-quinone oxidoreductase subunit M [Tepidisphaeraceae bacterium]